MRARLTPRFKRRHHIECRARTHARQTLRKRVALSTTEQPVWHCGDHIAKLESAICRRFLITKICCLPWHVGAEFAY